jgi:hypothetical protein
MFSKDEGRKEARSAHSGGRYFSYLALASIRQRNRSKSYRSHADRGFPGPSRYLRLRIPYNRFPGQIHHLFPVRSIFPALSACDPARPPGIVILTCGKVR